MVTSLMVPSDARPAFTCAGGSSWPLVDAVGSPLGSSRGAEMAGVEAVCVVACCSLLPPNFHQNVVWLWGRGGDAARQVRNVALTLPWVAVLRLGRMVRHARAKVAKGRQGSDKCGGRLLAASLR